VNDQKNLLIAIVASILIMVSFQYFWEKPKIGAKRTQQQVAESQPAGQVPPGAPGTAPAKPAAPGAPAPAPQAAAPAAPQAPDARLPTAPQAAPGAAPGQAVPPGGPLVAPAGPVITGPRVTVDNPSLHGSIALKGGAIDDITLKDYRQTVDAKSPPIRLLSPSGSPNAYYATHGWLMGTKAHTDSNSPW
jgi:YidC/Oxa1 family membrane protein insertase